MAFETTITNELPDGQLWVKNVADGVIHRHVISPGDDLSQETAAVRLRAEELHTPAVVSAFRAAQG